MGIPHFNVLAIRTVSSVVMLAICSTAFVTLSFAQKIVADDSKGTVRTSELAPPTPIFLPGNPTCSTVNALDRSGGPFDSRVDHIVDNFGFKIDQASPNYANVPFNNGTGPSRELQNGATSDPSRTVSMTTTGDFFNWSSTKQITAVIVKGGAEGANVYPYKPFSFGGIEGGGTGLITPGSFGVSHVVFCYGIQLAPSAGQASISGRVMDAGGRPVAGAVIQLWNVSTGVYRNATSGSMGYYTIAEVPVSDFYVLTATHGRLSFDNNTRSFTVNDDVTDVDFVQAF
jgi:hypothetical protein